MIDPRNMDITLWSDATAQQLATLGPMPALHSPQEWLEWAVQVIQTPQVARFSPPDPRGFPNWFEWACRFVQAVPL